MPTSTTKPKPREHPFPELAKLLRRRRRELGLTVKETAFAAGIPPWVVKWAEGDLYARLPPPTVVKGLSKALEVPVGELVRAAGYTEERCENA